jgi:hypothetical protein
MNESAEAATAATKYHSGRSMSVALDRSAPLLALQLKHYRLGYPFTARRIANAANCDGDPA